MKNLAFTTLIKSKGYSREMLADALHLSVTSVSRKAGGKLPWTWPEVGKVCETLGITLDDFAGYFPVGNVPASQHRCQAEKAELEAMRNLLAAFKAAAKAVG